MSRYIFSPAGKAKSAVCRSVSTGPTELLVGISRTGPCLVSKVGQDCRMWLGVENLYHMCCLTVLKL